ncbi:MAG: DUF1858 domain-containing protein [Candidatus Omnitrophica bacterium]|nr:DUF1858 domain-containing protein [Candidatus Omnitrophota bacterium]MCA9444647.1 DUF1858 domain-containing protein [Candidatus Omnitrophota bacterium]MCB9767450.1 DUF1858 domain-containing protein [Candidatus Omnitrophota bacterium]MCB9785013.1 DUF1858 domain-containing protein [Candidatus Omnitrophota bacterium]
MSQNQNETDPIEDLGSLSIHEAIETHPEILPTLYNHLGASCFDCPGRFKETLEKGILLHEADPQVVFGEIERVLKSE